jgi:RNA polymerase sigma factor (sigma-70 family)
VCPDVTAHDRPSLAARICTEDATSFALLWSCRPSVRSFLRWRGTDPATVEDVMGDVYEAAWRRRTRLPTDLAAARAWLRRAAMHALSNRLRRDRYQADVHRAAATDPAATGRHMRTDERIELVEAFLSLSRSDQRVLELAAVDGLVGNGLAEALGCSHAAACARLSRARERLQAAFDR